NSLPTRTLHPPASKDRTRTSHRPRRQNSLLIQNRFYPSTQIQTLIRIVRSRARITGLSGHTRPPKGHKMTDRESLKLCTYYLDNPALRRFQAIIRPEQFQEPGTSMLF